MSGGVRNKAAPRAPQLMITSFCHQTRTAFELWQPYHDSALLIPIFYSTIVLNRNALCTATTTACMPHHVLASAGVMLRRHAVMLVPVPHLTGSKHTLCRTNSVPTWLLQMPASCCAQVSAVGDGPLGEYASCRGHVSSVSRAIRLSAAREASHVIYGSCGAGA